MNKLMERVATALKDKQKLVRMFVVYLDGGPHMIVEHDGDAQDVARLWREAMTIPASVVLEVRDATLVPLEDLERVKLMGELKMTIFTMGQMQMAVRAGKTGLVIAQPGNH